MCSSNSKLVESNEQPTSSATVSDINGRPVLQPATSNRNSPLLERRSLKKTLSLPKSISMTTNPKSTQPPISPKLKSPRQPAFKRDMNTCSDKLILPLPKPTTPKHLVPAKKSKNSSNVITGDHSPGSIAAARREQVAVMQVQRKMRIAHYGRSTSAKYDSRRNLTSYVFDSNSVTPAREEKRCSFITPNSDPVYVAYHDYEWGVPAHDDKMLFELLVLTGAQVGSDWTSVLKKRQQFREAFSGFDAETVSKYSEKKIQAISSEHGIDVSLVRGVVDNSKSIIEAQFLITNHF
ncbi:uncharacterized protein LOC143617271 [Bidens hawaiensis]|uniref:uncharacterized protein LOC143617271 n=1 Tax=Bidens hawaiensis TaxID=980011 RepID=UPI0040499DA7